MEGQEGSSVVTQGSITALHVALVSMRATRDHVSTSTAPVAEFEKLELAVSSLRQLLASCKNTVSDQDSEIGAIKATLFQMLWPEEIESTARLCAAYDTSVEQYLHYHHRISLIHAAQNAASITSSSQSATPFARVRIKLRTSMDFCVDAMTRETTPRKCGKVGHTDAAPTD